jgi:ubiquinone/menaquinone biosynthesis C-methylase UbiE
MVESGGHTPPAWVLNNPIRRLLQPPRRDIDRLDPQPGESVIDVGAGPGYYADEVLSRLGKTGHLTLVDIDGSMLERYVRRHGADPRVRILVSSATAMPTVASGSVDRVLSATMLCDLQDKKGVMDEAWRVLRPGGTAFVSFHFSETAVASRPFWVTPPVWDQLRSQHPWEEGAHGARGGVRWHLLRKPSASR